MKHKLVASGLLAGLVAGTGAGFVLEQSGFAGASSGVAAVAVDDSSSTDPSTTIATTDSATTDSGATDSGTTTDSRPDPGQRIRDVLQPLVLGRAVRLHPVVILLGVTGGAVLGGIIGAFLAVPVLACASAVMGYVWDEVGPRDAEDPDDA